MRKACIFNNEETRKHWHDLVIAIDRTYTLWGVLLYILQRKFWHFLLKRFEKEGTEGSWEHLPEEGKADLHACIFSIGKK